MLVVGVAGIDVKGRILEGPKLHTSNAGHIRTSVGGTAHNIAENLARLGQAVRLLSAVGDDRNGRRVLAQANEAGVNTSQVIITSRCRTAAYLAVMDECGEMIISVDDMAVLDLITPQTIYQKRALVRDAAMIVMDSNLSPAVIQSLLKQASRYHVPVVADPTSSKLAQRLQPHLSNLLLVTPNIIEAEALSRQSIASRHDAIKAAKQLVARGVDIAIITLAELGVVYATPDVSGHIPAVKTPIVDTTGASDALTAAVVFGLLNDFPIDEALRLGASAAALTLACTDTVCVDLSLDWLYDQLLI